MRNIWGLILVVVIIVVFFFSMMTFQVRETETKVVTIFGKPVRTITEPGLYFRWPKPINNVIAYDSRKQLFEGAMEETSTKGGEPIIVTSYIIWNISEPLKFLESVRTVDGAENQLKSLLRDVQNSVIGQHYFSEFVNSDPEQIRFDDIENQMKTQMHERAIENFGIEVGMVGIKQLGVSQKVTQDVFERMRADRKRITEATLAQGNAEATRIETDAKSKRDELLAVAEAQAKAIRGAGDAEAARYYELLEADPELAMFLRDIEALKKILKDKTTVVLGADSDPIKLLKEIPDIEPSKSSSNQ